MNFPIQDQYAAEYLALIAAGAEHSQAVEQIAISNEVAVEEVEKVAA